MFKERKLFVILLIITIICFIPLFYTLVGAETVNLRFATYINPSYPELYPGMETFVKVVNEKGKGKIKAEFYPSETLLKAKELFSGLMGGAAEAVSVPMVYWHGTLPLSQGLSLPNLWKGGIEQYSKALSIGSPLANLLNENFAGKNLFTLFGVIECNEYLWTKDKAVKHPNDLKGMKIRASGLVPSEVTKRMEASPVSMPSGEIYTALQRGTVDGLLGSITTIHSRGLQEQINYMTDYSFDNFGPMVIGFRKDWWDKLPGDVQSIISEAGGIFSETLLRLSNKVTDGQVKDLKKKVKFITLGSDSTDAFNKVALPIHEWWVNRPEIGAAGKKLLELVRETEK